MPRDLPRVQPKSRKAWRAWLQKHHTASSGIWLVYAKKHTGIPSLTYNDAVEEALCFGWIDSLLQPLDDDFYMQMFTPRKPRSAWSALNRQRVDRLIEAGLMTTAGMKLVEIAKQTGRWEAHAAAEALIVPPDLQTALDRNAAARKNWDASTASARKMFLYYYGSAKRPDTRAARVARIIDILATKRTRAQRIAAAAKKTTTAGKKAR